MTDELFFQISNITRAPAIQYQGEDEKQYMVAPRSGKNELLAVLVSVTNTGDQPLKLPLDSDSVKLTRAGGKGEYQLLDLSPGNERNVRIAKDIRPAESLFKIFLDSPELTKGASITRWLVFEVPKGTDPKEIMWRIGDEVVPVDADAPHYLVAPSSVGNELVIVRLEVHNREATRVLMDIVPEAVELRGFGIDESYQMVDVSPTNRTYVARVDSSHKSEGRYTPFIANPVELAGEPGLPQGHSIIGWVVFDVPKGTRLRELKWDTGDTVFIRSS